MQEAAFKAEAFGAERADAATAMQALHADLEKAQHGYSTFAQLKEAEMTALTSTCASQADQLSQISGELDRVSQLHQAASQQVAVLSENLREKTQESEALSCEIAAVQQQLLDLHAVRISSPAS